MKKKLNVLVFVLLSFPLISIAQERVMETFNIPGAKCGDGSNYIMFFSEGPKLINGNPNNRLVIWLPGGGSTMIDRHGELTSAIKSFYEITDRLSVKNDLNLYLSDTYMTGERDFIFANHTDNDLFVKDAHWVILPYATQDFHSGNLDKEKIYDFTGVQKIVKQAENYINDEGTLNDLYIRFPSMNIEGSDVNGEFKIDKLEIGILHQGAKNIELSLDVLFNELVYNRGYDISNADVLLAGSSAGGFGTWYNAWRIGDYLYQHSGSRFTIVPQAGSPTTRVWDDAVQDLIVNDTAIIGMDHRLGWHNVSLPCSNSGGDYTTGDTCRDALDLLNHYHNRWDSLDVRFLAVVNKEDFLATRSLVHDEGELLNFCKTVHRYAQYFYLTPKTFPYAAWLFKKTLSDSVKRVHGFKGAALTVDMIKPDGKDEEGYSLLQYINMVAVRNVLGPAQIEHVAGVIQDPDNYSSEILGRANYLLESNVDWPDVVSVKQNTSNNKLSKTNISFYPNPTSGVINVQSKNVQSIEVINLLGQKIKTFSNTTKINLSSLAKGFYFLKIKTDSKVNIKKVLLR